jgi:hypothetical protein
MAGSLVLTSGCAMFRSSTEDLDPNQPKHMTAKYDYTDLHQLTQSVASELLADPLLAKPAEPPLMRLGEFQNRTEQHVDTKALSQGMRTLLLQSGKVQFVAESQRAELLKEQEYQSKHGEKDTQVRPGQQANPRYMISGSLIEIKMEEPRQVRISKKEVRYYTLTVEVTDLQTGRLAWSRQKEITRQASQPLIGW